MDDSKADDSEAKIHVDTVLGGVKDSLRYTALFSSEAYTARLIVLIDGNRDSGRPVFGYLAFTAPHSPLQAPNELVDKYEPIYARGWDVIRAERYRRLQNSGLAPAEQALPPRWPEVPAWDSLSETKRAIEARKMALYAGLIDNMDQNIGRLLTRLRDIGEYENTVVFFLSDNGAEHVDPEVLDALIMKALLLGSDNSYDNMGKPGSFVFAGPPWANVSATHLRGHKGGLDDHRAGVLSHERFCCDYLRHVRRGRRRTWYQRNFGFNHRVRREVIKNCSSRRIEVSVH